MGVQLVGDVTTGDCDEEVSFEVGIEDQTVAGAVVSHAIQPVAIDVGVVADELVLAALTGVEEQLELVKV